MPATAARNTTVSGILDASSPSFKPSPHIDASGSPHRWRPGYPTSPYFGGLARSKILRPGPLQIETGRGLHTDRPLVVKIYLNDYFHVTGVRAGARVLIDTTRFDHRCRTKITPILTPLWSAPAYFGNLARSKFL